MQFEELTTARLILRKLTPDAYRYLNEHLNDDELAAFLGLESEKSFKREKEKYRQGYTSFNRSMVSFLLIEKESMKVIGDCAYHTWIPNHFRAELGYGLYKDVYKQKGYMNEALEAVLDYGFNTMNLHRVEALAATDNTASLNLLKKFGFKFEGILREHYNVDGVMDDSVMHSLLRHEFKKST